MFVIPANAGTQSPKSWAPAFAGVTILLVLWLALAACGAPAPEAPSITRVEDHSGLLTPAAERRIEAKLAQLERRTTDQVAVKTVTTLGGEPIEEVSIRTARTAGLGQMGKDNGVLLFVAPTEKKVRIETGRGIAGVLTDAEAAAIVREMVAAFGAGQMERGIEIGVREIDRELSADPIRPALLPKEEPWPT